MCVSGDEIECRLIMDGDESASAARFPFERVRESRLNIEPEPECEGRWFRTRLRRGSDETEGCEPSRVWPVLLRGSGDEAWGAGAVDAGAAEPRRELRGLNIDAKTDRRRVVPVPFC